MSNTLYISNRCIACTEVVKYLKEEKINCKVINVDTNKVTPPIRLMIFPALLNGDRVIAYGHDIIAYFKKERAVSC